MNESTWKKVLSSEQKLSWKFSSDAAKPPTASQHILLLQPHRQHKKVNSDCFFMQILHKTSIPINYGMQSKQQQVEKRTFMHTRKKLLHKSFIVPQLGCSPAGVMPPAPAPVLELVKNSWKKGKIVAQINRLWMFIYCMCYCGRGNGVNIMTLCTQDIIEANGSKVIINIKVIKTE